MDKTQALKVLQEAKQAGGERKFKQSVDLIINLKDLDLKKPDNQVDFYVTLHNENGRKVRVCALVGPELKDEAQKNCDTTIHVDDFGEFQKDKKRVKKLAETHEYFIAQANIMAQVATAFGRVLGPRGKMPNPKAGCVVPPKAALKPLVERLQKTVRVSAKKAPVIQILVGKESMQDDVIADNIMFAFNQVQTHLPQEANNIKNAIVKLSMGKPVKLA
jgi:large subunit ribosomal protein L1